MAERAYTEKELGGGVKLVTWTGLTKTTDDTGAWYRNIGPRFGDKSVHVFGTFGTGGTVAIQGSNEAENITSNPILNDAQGNALSVSTGKIEQILENPAHIRPAVSAGDGTTNLTVILCIRR